MSPIKALGGLGFIIWLVVIVYTFTNANKIDRFLANNNAITKVLVPLLLVLFIPFILSLFHHFCFCSFEELNTFNDDWLSPFLNHAKSYAISDQLISLLGTFLLSGVVVSLLVNYISRRAEKWINGESHYTFRNNYYHVIIGSHPSVPYLANEILKEYKKDIVIVFSKSDIPQLRRKIESTVKQRSQIVMYYGNRDSETDLSHLNVGSKKLKNIYILGEGKSKDKDFVSNDTMNMNCFEILKRIRKKCSCGNIDCYVFFEHQSTSVIFQRFNNESETKNSSLNFIPYNFYELHAQKLLGWNDIDGNRTINIHEGIGVNTDNHVHLFIIGMSKMGMALGLEAIRVCHYPNFAKAQMDYEYGYKESALKSIEHRRTKITFIDHNMSEKFVLFKSRYRKLLEEIKYTYVDGEIKTVNEPHSNGEKPILDIELEFINDWIQSDLVHQYINNVCDNPMSLVSIVSCLSLSNQSVASILCLSEKCLSKAKIAVYQPESEALVDNIQIGTSKTIVPFGMSSSTVSLKHIVLQEEMARRISYVYQRSDSERELMVYDKKSMYDFVTNTPTLAEYWRNLNELRKWSNRYRASYLWQVKDYLNFENIEDCIINGIEGELKDHERPCDGLLARVEHNRFCIERYSLGVETTDTKALWSYKALEEDSKEAEPCGLYTFPTNDQIMIVAIPYILEDRSSLNESRI
ncbi:MAG: hypothetical protein KBT06_09825 [Prevotellaceae bacterium]|nr:hypothetical protein [Candidatus Colivivens equi]